jgi:mono/diheme cytochrome c family protein
MIPIGINGYAGLGRMLFILFGAALGLLLSWPADGLASKQSVARGKKIFDSQICRDCHTMEGRGAKAAPDLTEIWKKEKRTRDWIIGHLRNPHQYDHFTIMPDFHFSREEEEALSDYLLAPK